MRNVPILTEARLTADVVFERLHEDIVNLALLPGSKMSEAEVGRRFGVSRQPLRDAFRRLGNLDLLEIRPQRATVVRRFSLAEIANTRFLRLAIELEVIDHACEVWDQSSADGLSRCLAEQEDALEAADLGKFHELDYGFHELICDRSGHPMAFETINACKRKVDRLFVLSLSHDHGVAAVLDDHRAIADALAIGSTTQASALTHNHLSRLDATITEIHQTHNDYFQ